MEADLLYDLENRLNAASGESEYPEIVAGFIADNQEWVDSLTA